MELRVDLNTPSLHLCDIPLAVSCRSFSNLMASLPVDACRALASAS